MRHSPAALHVKNAPSSKLVFTYFGGAVASFVFVAGWTFLHHAKWGGFFAGIHQLAWMHMAVLGWINLTIFAVLFQFVPVVLNVKLASEKLAWSQLVFYLPGAIGMIVCFWSGRLDWPLHTFATILWIGCMLFIWNLLLTYRRVTVWTWTARYLYAAVLYLLATILLGLFLSIHVAYPLVATPHPVFLKVHALVGFGGWILCVVIGVALKLLPMFLLSHGFSLRPAAYGFWMIHAGLIVSGVATGFRLPVPLVRLGALVLLGGIGACLLQVVLVYRARNRVRATAARRREVRKLEFPLVFGAWAFGNLAVAVGLGIGVTVFGERLDPIWMNRLVLAYGVTFVLGFPGLLIQAFLYKIIPFLVWLHKFRNVAGRVRVPNIRQLTPATSGIGQLALYSMGAVCAVIASVSGHSSLAGIASAAMAASSLWLVVNLALIWTRAKPLPSGK